jgi:hypothetical protein
LVWWFQAWGDSFNYAKPESKGTGWKGSAAVCFAFFAKSFAYFAVRRETQSKTAKIAKPNAQSFAKKRFRLPKILRASSVTSGSFVVSVWFDLVNSPQRHRGHKGGTEKGRRCCPSLLFVPGEVFVENPAALREAQRAEA